MKSTKCGVALCHQCPKLSIPETKCSCKCHDPIEDLTAKLPRWVKNRYLRWWRRYNLCQRRNGLPEESFEAYMGSVLKNALEKMNDL